MSDLGNKEIMAKNIKRLLEEHDMSQTDLCNALGFKFMTVSDWVNTKSYPRIDKIEMMANFFGVSKADLVEEQKPGEYYIDPQTAAIAQEIKDNIRAFRGFSFSSIRREETEFGTQKPKK